MSVEFSIKRKDLVMNSKDLDYSPEHFNPEHVEIRAKWLAGKWNLDEQRVTDILDKTVIREGIAEGDNPEERLLTSDLIYHLRFKPSLEDALLYLRKDVALRMFESVDLEKVEEWLRATHRLARKYVDSYDLYSWEWMHR